jgi:Anti sigma-E protein RseA, N-terminal domain
MNDAIKMQISAFVDGELPENEAQLLLRRMSQDRELRQQAAEYLAVGRVIRAERVVPGIGGLRARIECAIDDTAIQQELDTIASSAPRFVRPLAGFAIAATVALAGVLGLQRIAAVDDPDGGNAAAPVAEAGTGGGYTVPMQPDDQLREYYLRHSASSSYFGGSSINARLVTLQLREGVLVEVETADDPVDDTDSEAEDAAESQEH